MSVDPPTFVVFIGNAFVARGSLVDVAAQAKARLDGGAQERIALFDDLTGRPVDVDFSGTAAAVTARLADHPMAVPETPRRPGRPKLGVVSREVSLLPRHWAWLAEQRGGASAALRKLVDTARKSGTAQERSRKAVDAAHRFMWDMAGDQPGFEEASRALFAHDFDALARLTAAWPAGIVEQLARFTARAHPGEPAGSQ